MKPSMVRENVVMNTMTPIIEAFDEQRKDAAVYEVTDDKIIYRFVGVQVPKWYHDILVILFEGSGIAPCYSGQPITVGEHEEIKILWWNPTMALDVGATKWFNKPRQAYRMKKLNG
jgi:hypothetical protein